MIAKRLASVSIGQTVEHLLPRPLLCGALLWIEVFFLSRNSDGRQAEAREYLQSHLTYVEEEEREASSL